MNLGALPVLRLLTSWATPVQAGTEGSVLDVGRLFHAPTCNLRPSAKAITFTYTARNQKKTEKDRLGNTTAFSYDPAGNLLTISDAENEAKKATVTPAVYEAGKTRYTWDERDLLATQTLPGPTGGVVAFGYWPNGQEKTRTDQRGIVRTSVYDAANRLTDRTYSDGTADHFVLDDAGRVTSATASRSGVVVGRTYYPTGLIKSETTTWPFGISGTSTSATVQYAYDAANRATTLTLPDGRTLDRTFTARNELESLTIGGESIATLGYDNAGRRTSALYGNGLVDSRGFTDNNLLKTTVLGPEAAPLLSLEYAYDAGNRKTSETDHRDSSRSVGLGYDDNDRLTSWTTGANPKLPTSRTWDLSAVGDWTKTTVDGVIENREHTAVHEVKTRNGVAVGYDPAGNLIRTADGQTFAWDAENRLLAADTVPNADGAKDKAVYQTDAFGRRVAKSVYGSTYLAIHDGWQVVQELSGPTTLPASAAADDGSLANLATVPAGAILPTTYDAQGNPQYPTRINFQPATTSIPSGYLADKSKDFAVRSNGLSYGWTAAEGAPSRSEPVIRYFMPLPQYDTFVPTGDPETWTWQIALPAGSYPVVLVLGDATNREHTFNVTVQGETFPDPHPYDPEENTGYEAGRFVGVAKQATVGADGLLTIQAAAGALNGTLCWLEVGAEGTQITEELRQKLADEVTHANARTGGSPFWDGGRSETKTFVWGPGIDELMGYQRTTAETGTTTLFVHSNAQWSVYAVTDDNGQVVERFQYTATGKRASDVAGANGRSLVGLSTGWTGRDHQEATGTIYFRNREWEPEYQFINRDPAGYVDGMSLYRGYFVPNAMDPMGLWTNVDDDGPRAEWKSETGDTFATLAARIKLSPMVGEVNNWLKPTHQTVDFEDCGFWFVGDLKAGDVNRRLKPDQKFTTPNVWIAADLMQGGSVLDNIWNMGGTLGTFVGTDLFTWGFKIERATSPQDLLLAIHANKGDIWGMVVFGHGNANTGNFLATGPLLGGSRDWNTAGVDYIPQSYVTSGLSAQGFKVAKTYAMQCYSFCKWREGTVG